MPDLWMPGATRHSIGNTRAMDGGPPRVVWHTTSNDRDHVFENEVGWFTSGGASEAPHLIWDPFTGQIAQLFPADSRSLSLQNDGAVRTNRTGQYCIQIETVFTQNETVGGKTYASVAETPCKGLPQIMAWLRSLGIPVGWPGGAPTAFHRQDVSLAFWQSHAGHYGHCHVPGNSHVDPGPMPASMFATTPEEDMTPAQAQQLADIHKAVVEASIASRIDGGMHTLADHTAATNAATIHTQAEVAALQATVAALAKGGSLTPAEIIAAAQAGAAAALAKLGSALSAQKPAA